MITPREYPSRDLIERVAEDYRRRGYQVIVEPRPEDLPDFLRDATPDLIAERGDEHIVVELKRSPREADRRQIAEVSKRISAHYGWRFVVMASAPDVATRQALLDERGIQQQLAEANELLDAGHPKAGLLLAWASIEALLRLVVIRDGSPAAGSDPAALLRRAASEGVLDHDDYRSLSDAFKLRSEIVHGFRPSQDDPSTDAVHVTRSLARISESLLAELNNPTA